MPSDDPLRELFRRGRADDLVHAPPFEQMWDAAQRSRQRRMVAGIALAVAALIAIIAGWIVLGVAETRNAEPQRIAETSPLPDIPVDGDSDQDDAALGELADWDRTDGALPTDFLIEDEGVLAGSFPTGDFDDVVLDLDHLTMEL